MRSSSISGLCLLFLLVLCQVLWVWSNGDEHFYPNEKNCGLTEEIPGDVRTYSPWTVAIYKRNKNETSSFQYFVAGSLSGSDTVVTVFGGGFGHHPYKRRNKRYYIPPPDQFLVVAGLPSTNLSHADQFSQFANVSYISPYNANFSGHEEFQLVILKLVKPLKLNTPYVRALCQPFGVLPYLRSVGFDGLFTDVVSFDDEPGFVSGFDAPINVSGHFPAVVIPGTFTNSAACRNSYKFHYRSKSGEIFCGKVAPEKYEEANNSTCITHGSVISNKPNYELISLIPSLGPNPRHHSTGPIAIIPKKDRGFCGVNSTYYVIAIYPALEWIKSHMTCSSESYPCNNGKCIPLNQICDGKVDCDAGGDEDPIKCMAIRRCKSRNAYQCGLEGKCIRLDQVGDGIMDCPSGSDEDVRLFHIKTLSTNFNSISSKEEECVPLVLSQSEGVIATCRHPQFGKMNCSEALPETEVILSCAPKYTPMQKTNAKSLKMKCCNDRLWRPFRSFSCQPVCGLVSNEERVSIDKDLEGNAGAAFPWHASILKQSFDGSFNRICGASLIERNVLLTAAHCTTDAEGNPYYNSTSLKIIFSSRVNFHNFRERIRNNLEIYEIQEVWRPPFYNAETLELDIAVIKLVKPVTYSEKIKPICYLGKKFKSFPSPNSTGVMPGFGAKRNDVMLSSMRRIDLEVLPQNQCRGISFDKFCAKTTKVNEPICYGPGGSGLVVEFERTENFTLYLLKGVASFREEMKQIQCESDSLPDATFTHIDSYSEWLLTVLEAIDVNPLI